MVSMLSICVNPFLYGYLNTNFRREFGEIYSRYVICLTKTTGQALLYRDLVTRCNTVFTDANGNPRKMCSLVCCSVDPLSQICIKPKLSGGCVNDTTTGERLTLKAESFPDRDEHVNALEVDNDEESFV
ncbi:hypothetical protein KIN20_023633 [Parelaphostrongylus tenuis]|uniref:G-protein coupled receptors family 1 profile domain-containing protein n=1 Tax=Parelaphostrongylus tenuis TaxID=148309 RepID=A0AAD5N7C8_PARTN|nr:hypothetical protein KIN20_023633 [Parelaphostrongylus tenuis]